MPAAKFTTRLDTTMQRGDELMEQANASETMDGVKDGERDMYTWSDFNVEFLKQAFNTQEIAEQYVNRVRTISFGGRSTFAEEKDDLIKDVRRRLDALKSIRDRIELWADDAPPDPDDLQQRETPQAAKATKSDSRRVFVVHGHDAELKETVGRYLEHLGLEPIILHEQPNHGRTLIEKFEVFADVQFAVVLLTPDDVGGPNTEHPKVEPRPRQNVVLELGYFLGRLGRGNVCALVKHPIELPTDYDGVVYVPIDDGGGWKLRLAKEIKSVLPIDMNAAVS